jgi:TonB family protein
MTMGTDMSRFVLFSAALHLGVLAALSDNAARPPLFPATLTVSLNAASDTAAAPRHLHDTHGPSTISGASTADNVIKSRLRPKPENDPTQERVQIDSSRSVTLHTHHEEIRANDVSSDLSSPPKTTATIESRHWPAGPDEGKKMYDVPPQADAAQAQQTDTKVLASQLESKLRDALAPYFTYPLMARRNGWQGQVQVGVRVEADGRLSHVHIAHSSGHRLLDNAALTTLTRITTLPEAAGWLDGRHFDMVLPIEYRLIDGQS